MQSSDTLSKTSEIGSLIAHSNNESQFVGSSSGVFFVNTVRQAFAKSLGPQETSPTPEFPAPEDTIVGPPKSPSKRINASRNKATTELLGKWTYVSQFSQVLGKAPLLEDARQLMMMYFKLWHSLFPFLHGPSFLQAMEAFYSESSSDGQHQDPVSEHRRACWTIIFQCVFNIASLLQPDLRLAQESRITSGADLLKLIYVLLDRHDILSIQALLAMQLYLVATMSLRNASLLGGVILRSVLHAGFHRCPYRYPQLNSHDCQLRKRVFWCFYAIDRHLSQALGLPLGIQDSDIDVCLPGILESHVPSDPPSVESRSLHGERVPGSVIVPDIRDSRPPYTGSMPPSASEEGPPNREATLAGFVTYGRLVGRALELFHKSISQREIRRSAVLYLVSDVHKWWNNLPSSLQGTTAEIHIESSTNSDFDEESSFDMSPIFPILYKHLILCINRPCLSLEPYSPDFCSGLQICIDAARSIISLLKTQLAKGLAVYWPGLLSAAYMAGLVIAFACHLGQYSLFKGCQEISNCLDILHAMCRRWDIAKHCHTALSILLLNIQRQSRNPSSTSMAESVANHIHWLNDLESFASEGRKRRKIDDTDDTEQQNRATYCSINNDQTNQDGNSPLRDSQNFVFGQQTGVLLQGADQRKELSSTILDETPQNYQTTRAFCESTDNSDNSQIPTLAMPHGNEFDDLQWPDESSFLTTNFDLNMTDLFQNSSWDPMLFDAFNQD